MKILLHICCGICAASVSERLLAEGHRVTGYFFNPNIHPAEEYEKRLEAAWQVARWAGITLEPAMYQPDEWLRATAQLAQEPEGFRHLWREAVSSQKGVQPEGGQRCEVCFRIRLQATYDYLQQHDFDAFTTTLTVSPHKSAPVVNRVGQAIGGEMFLARDFKKKDGFKRSNEIAKQLGLYHQNYCGCVYSLDQRTKV